MSPTDWAVQRQTRRQIRRSLRALKCFQVPVRADGALGLWLSGGSRPRAPAECSQPLMPRGIHNTDCGWKAFVDRQMELHSRGTRRSLLALWYHAGSLVDTSALRTSSSSDTTAACHIGIPSLRMQLLGTIWWYTNAVLLRLILPLQNLRIAIMVSCGHDRREDFNCRRRMGP
jgi:hypothetical protein